MMLLSQLLFLLFFQTISATQNVKVTTSLGKIQGSTLTTRVGKTIYAFRGIRYAQPPINELRFKPPVPVERWSGIYNATADGPICPQPAFDPVSEDCLFLNVYITKLPNGTNNPKRPVIIYLHPGGFFASTGRSNSAGPQYLLDQEIVLVTLNYRIASLGFMSLGKEVPGNNGLRDQVMAMKWVKNNIAAFGGDPNSVTMYGYSAGAWSISLHMVSPMSRELFHKAILGSGSALGQWPLPRTQVDLAKKQARLLGCPDSNSKEILDCLKTKPAEYFGSSLPRFAEFGNDLTMLWSPVIEEDYGQERFLSDEPIKLYKKGKFEKIPVMVGVTEYEFANAAYLIVANSTFLKEFSDNFEKYAPMAFLYERNTPRSREISQALRKFYLGDGPLSNASLPGLKKIYADIIGFMANRAVDLISEYSNKPVFYYELTYRGRYSFFLNPATNKTIGAVHHDELMYNFYVSTLFPFFDQSFPEHEMVETLTSLWANFAKTGKPHTNGNYGEDDDWESYNIRTKKYMDIGKQLVLKNNLFKDRYAFWRRLFSFQTSKTTPYFIHFLRHLGHFHLLALKFKS